MFFFSSFQQLCEDENCTSSSQSSDSNVKLVIKIKESQIIQSLGNRRRLIFKPNERSLSICRQIELIWMRIECIIGTPVSLLYFSIFYFIIFYSLHTIQRVLYYPQKD